jgi:hypothetical protein
MLSTMVRMIFKLCFQDIGNEFIDTVCWNIYNAGQCKISCAYLDSAWKLATSYWILAYFVQEIFWWNILSMQKVYKEQKRIKIVSQVILEILFMIYQTNL